MTDQYEQRCPSCDTSNAAHATFCSHCGKPMGTHAAAPAAAAAPPPLRSDSSATAYVIAAVAVATVLIVGGALFLLAGGDDNDGSASATTAPGASAGVAPESVPTAPPTTDAEVAATTAAATTAPSPTTPPATVPPETAPPETPPPETVPPSTAAPAPVSTVPPAPTVPITFNEAEVFFRGYIETAISRDYLAAWNRLSSRDQSDYSGGFDQFVGFWQSVSTAQISGISSLAGSNSSVQSLAVDIAYGQVDGDPTSFEMVEVDVNRRPDGTLQIFDYRFIGAV